MKQILLIISLVLTTQVFAQQLKDSSFKMYTKEDLREVYLQESKDKKTTGYIFLGVSLAATVGMLATAENASIDEIAGPFFLGAIALGTVGVGFSKLSKGARYKGMADMIGNYPDPSDHAAHVRKYQSSATVYSIVAWGLLTGGIITTYVLNKNDAEGNAARYGGLAISFASLPFFMAAGNSKGRVAILTRTEKINMSALQGTGTHRTIGISLPIGR